MAANSEIDDASIWETADGEEVTYKELRERLEQANAEKAFFVLALMNATFHWFFDQALTALKSELYLPGLSSLLNGIEASIRVTLHEIDPAFDGRLELSPYRLLSNRLLMQARDVGMEVRLLAFPGEGDFGEKLETNENVKLVQLRHDVCHGNVTRFIASVPNTDIEYFTPECVRKVSAELLGISFEWARALGEFRLKAGLRPPEFPIPAAPTNPLAEWL